METGVDPHAVEAPGEGPLTGKTFVFAGTLETMSRPDAEALVRKLGGKAAGSVSAKTSYVVAGPNAGSKLDKGQKLKLKILDEEPFLALVPKEWPPFQPLRHQQPPPPPRHPPGSATGWGSGRAW